MTSQPGQQTMTIHILPNISLIKSNQAIELGQVIQDNKRKRFPWNSCRKWGVETRPRPPFVF